MKAMLTGFVAIIIIAIGAWYGLGEIGYSAAEQNASGNVRLD